MERLSRPQSNMKLCVCLFVWAMALHGASARTHSLMYIVTASSGLQEFPEHNEVGIVNGQVFMHYDSNLKTAVPKTDWINQNVDADYWKRETNRNINTQQVFKANVAIAMSRLNQTDGVHIVQYMYGCEWDDETGRVRGFRQHGFDGEDYLFWDSETNTWIAPRQEAFITKQRWNSDKADLEYYKAYLNDICPEWLKKYVRYGEKTLMRTELPSISLLQKSSSFPVTCHATGFYPDGAVLFWTKDGEELYEGVEMWEVLPNHDGTFQKSADLDVSSIPPEDWHRYNCVFQLSGVEEDVLTKLDKGKIRTNEKPQTALIITAVVVVLCVALVAALGFAVYKWKKNPKRPPTPVSEPGVEEELNPKT